MGAAILALVGAILGGALGAAGGYFTARQQGRQAVELERLRAAEERQRHRSQLAVEIARIELERSPDNPYAAAEHVAVLTQLLRDLDTELDSTTDRPVPKAYVPVPGSAGPDSMDSAVERFRAVYCSRCGYRRIVEIHEPAGYCNHCGVELDPA